MDKQNQLARHGLTLSKSVLRRLNQLGITAQSQVRLEHQSSAKQYVVRGIESGGAVREMGRYVTYSGANGDPLFFLHPLDAIGVNGVHAVVVAPILLRIELFRVGRTCQLLITEHRSSDVKKGRRPLLENKILFRGVNGLIDMTPAGAADKQFGLPQFWSRAGEKVEIPLGFAPAVAAAAIGARCVGCSHCHFLRTAGRSGDVEVVGASDDSQTVAGTNLPMA